MKVIKSPTKLQNEISKIRKSKTIALVPTMGALHEGHLSLVKLAKKKADVVIVSIFVNPTQFGPKEDLNTYPRPLKSDLAKLKKLGVPIVFTPQKEDLYNKDHQSWIHVEKVTKGLCGAKRPGHFRGVATIVFKLLMITNPHIAIFGCKDYQQLVTIQTMIRDLNIPIKIIGAPIVREKDGLAMSSRNTYLSIEERTLALRLNQGLKIVKRTCQQGTLSVKTLGSIFQKTIGSHKKLKIDYFECRHKKSLEELKMVKPGETLVACAVFVGKTRLIDNIII